MPKILYSFQAYYENLGGEFYYYGNPRHFDSDLSRETAIQALLEEDMRPLYFHFYSRTLTRMENLGN
jgi:hypothetical protein